MELHGFKKAIAEMLLQENYYQGTPKGQILDKVQTMINWAWENWDAPLLRTYYNGEKPQKPTAEFVKQWIFNEDFDADGFDENLLKSYFN